MKNEPLVFEQTFNAPAEKVWKALTDNDQVKQWYFDFAEFKPETGFEFQFEGGPDEKKYLHVCKITDVVHNKKLSYTWKYDGYPGESLVSFDLIPEGDKTKLKLTHEALETFPAENPDFAKQNFEEGWKQIIGTSLKKFLEKNN